VQKRLLSNVCRYRGYVLEGYPESYEEAQALFTKLVPADGEEEPAEDAEDEEEEEEEAAPPDEDEEDEEEGKPQRKLDAATAPEFMVVLHSSEEACRRRLFANEARGPQDEEVFARGTAQYQKDNLPKDGSPSTSDFFKEVAGLRVLEADVDENSQDSVFQSMCVYMEAKGQFFNYLRSEEELTRVRETQAAEREAKAAEEQRLEKARVKEAEQGLMAETADAEAARRQLIKDGESALLDSEAMPLRQYLLRSVVPTLSDGLSKVCKEQPEDPIEYLAQYLFAHAQDIESGGPL
jgi:adenylate kinase